MKINPIEMMHSLSRHSYDVLLEIAENENICCTETRLSKIELITMIITAHVEREARADIYKMAKDGGRKKYRLCTEDDSYYLKLTDEQAIMLEWCADNEVDFCNSVIEEMGDIVWETP